MRDIFTKDFILKVLLPILATIVFGAILYFAYSPFVVFLGLIVFSSLFFYSKYTYSYDKDLYGDYYDDEDETYTDSPSLLDKVKGLLPIGDKDSYDDEVYEEYDEYEEEIIEAPPAPKPRQQMRQRPPRQAPVRQDNYGEYDIEPNPYENQNPRRQVIDVQVTNQVRRTPEPIESAGSAPTRRLNPNQVNQASAGAGETRQYARPAQAPPKPQRRRVQPQAQERVRQQPQQPRRTTRQNAYSQQQRPARRAPQKKSLNDGYDDDYEFEYYPYDD